MIKILFWDLEICVIPDTSKGRRTYIPLYQSFLWRVIPDF